MPMPVFALFKNIFSEQGTGKTKKFFSDTARIKEIAREQMTIDEEFRKEMFSIKKNLFTKKTGSLEFWSQYKTALNKSIEKNKKNLDELLKRTDREMKEKLKETRGTGNIEAEENQIDLQLPK